jgi:hypothetical protein
MMCSWTHLPSSSATTLTHAFNTATEIAEYSYILSSYTCWNSSNVFCPCPHFICPDIMAFQVNTYWDGILLNTLQASFMFPHFANINQVIPHKDIGIPSTFNDLFMSTLALFKFAYTSTCI